MTHRQPVEGKIADVLVRHANDLHEDAEYRIERQEESRWREAGPRLRAHINVFVDGRPADLATPVGAGSMVHVIPAISGGSPPRLR